MVRIRYRLVFQSVIFRRLPVPWQGALTGSLVVQGTYTDVVGAGSCKPCPAGMYCSMAALTEPEGHCQPGYYCIQGSSSSSPVSAEYLTLLQTFWDYKSFHKPYSFYFLASGGASIWRSLPTGTLLPCWHDTPKRDAMPCWHLEWTEGSPGCHMVSALCPWVFLQYVWPRCSCRTLCTR